MTKEAPSTQSPQAGSNPEVSIVMACFNAEQYLNDAVQSALAQRDIELEVIIVDDHSTDGSLTLANRLAQQDKRVRVMQTPANAGPGGARNVGLKAMRGEWYAMLDCDDAFEPSRCRTLIDAANTLGAHMIADDLLVFGDDLEEHKHLGSRAETPPRLITLDDYFDATRMFGPKPNLGFLKPLVRRETMLKGSHFYREDLKIGEDDELVVQLLLAGSRYFVSCDAMYRYRKHEASISHRLSVDHSARMTASEELVRASVLAAGRDSPAYRARYSSILDAAAFTKAVDALKARDFGSALHVVAARPGSVRHFSMPLSSRLARLRARLGLS